MEVIYATGRPGQLEFHLTDKRENVPAGAIIFAICMSGRTIENTDEDLFEAITDREYFTAQEMIRESTRRVTLHHSSTPSTLKGAASRFLRWLTGAQPGGQPPAIRKNPSNC